MQTPEGFKKEIIGERSVEHGSPGSGNYAFSREFIYVLVCKECGAMVWEDEALAAAHRKMHQSIKVAPMGIGGVFG